MCEQADHQTPLEVLKEESSPCRQAIAIGESEDDLTDEDEAYNIVHRTGCLAG